MSVHDLGAGLREPRGLFPGFGPAEALTGPGAPRQGWMFFRRISRCAAATAGADVVRQNYSHLNRRGRSEERNLHPYMKCN